MADDTTPIRVLHVDDDTAFAELTATFLEREDGRFDVITASGASEGLATLEAEPVDCVVSDYDMPETDGIAFLETLREDHPDLPVILFTGKGSEEIASEAISSGVTDYLQKERATSQYTVLANRVKNAVEQYRSKRALEGSEKRHSLFVEQSPLGVIEWDDDFAIAGVNRAAERILGYSEAELLGESWKIIVPSTDASAVSTVVEQLLEDEGGFHSVNENVRKDGDRIVCEWHNHVVTDDDEVVAIFSQFQDITRQRRHRDQLEALNEQNQELMTAESRQAVVEVGVRAARDILDLEANAIHLYDETADALVPVAATEAVYELVGDLPTFTGDDGIGWRVFQDGEPVAVDDVQADPNVLNPETPIRSELHVPIGEHGILIAGSLDPAAFDDPDVVLGEILAGNIRTALDQVDRTEQLHAREAELERQNDRLNEFASVVSHDLRNPLTVASGRLELLGVDEDNEIHLQESQAALARMHTLIDDLLALARQGRRVESTESLEVEALARECWNHVLTEEATLTVEGDCVVEADPNRLRQLFENLFRNAVEHGGPAVTVTVEAIDGGFAVEDDGTGLDGDAGGDVFEAGYSTNPNGTGFGLSIVKQVVDAHEWSLRLGTGSNGGVRFEITGVEGSS